MSVQLDKILKPKEWLILTAGLLAAGAIYVGLIHPSLQSTANLEQSRSAKTQAEDELNLMRAKLQQLHQQISEDEQRLARAGGSPPKANEKDLLVSEITKLATACGIVIDRYSPIDTVDETDHRAFFVEFVGRGDFIALQHYFKRLQSEIDFVDITHFSIISMPKSKPPQCLVTWSCRINVMRPDNLEPQQTALQQSGYETLMEVALNGP